MESKISARYWIVGSLAVFVIHTLFGYFVSRFIYPPSALPLVSSSSVQDPLFARLFIHLSRLIFAGGFTFVFLRLYQGKVGIATGVRYGFLMAVLLDIPAFFADMVRTQWTTSVILLLCLVGMMEAILLGVILSMLSGPVGSLRAEKRAHTLYVPPKSQSPILKPSSQIHAG
ncbi:MAG: hypothetical protein HW412_866 [Bacteroidetes bacterium]|nr:hypothetical protein [Bacteroidota bacterium]